MKKLLFLLAFLPLIVFFSCSRSNDESFTLLSENEFKVEPNIPSSSQDISVITFDCKYNQFGYINKKGFNIEVVKHFNSMMKLPCVLDYDTIPLGKLAAGTYQLTFTIVDRSTMLLGADSISSTQTQVLVVKK